MATGDLPRGLSAPARRALTSAGYTRLEQIETLTPRDLLALHGVGPNAIETLREALAAVGKRFAGDRKAGT